VPQYRSELATAERDALWQALDLLDGEYRQWGDLPHEIHVEVLRHLVSCIVLRLAHLRGMTHDADRGGAAFLRFQQDSGRGLRGPASATACEL
jgi:hypothetical protein